MTIETINCIEDLAKSVIDELKNGKQLENLHYMLAKYHGQDWKDYVNFNKDTYVRNLVYQDDNIDILILCWNSYQQSGIHDHPENGCLLRIMQGKLTEEVYEKDVDNKFILKEENKLLTDEISYQVGKDGLHNIINEDEEQVVSIHIYSPPNYRPQFY